MTDDVFYVNNQYYHNYQNNPLLAINQDYESYLDIHEIDVKKKPKGVLLKESELFTIGPILLPEIWNAFQLYQLGSISLVDNVNSQLVYAVHEDESESYIFLINTVEGELKSVAVLSRFFFVSEGFNGHSYASIQDDKINVYDRFIFIDDIIDETRPSTIPIYVRIRRWVIRIFSSRKKKYPCAITIQLNRQGFLKEL